MRAPTIANDAVGAIRDLPAFRQRRSVPIAPFASMLTAARGGARAKDVAAHPVPTPEAHDARRTVAHLAAPHISQPVPATDRVARPTPAAPELGGYSDLISTTAARHGVDPTLVAAVIRAESGFDRNAVSRSGAKGLMQLMDGTARSLGVADPFNAEQNVEGGTRFLSSLLSRFGSVDLALAAYNAGPIAVATHGGIPPYRETQTYVRKVLDYQKGYQSGATT